MTCHNFFQPKELSNKKGEVKNFKSLAKNEYKEKAATEESEKRNVLLFDKIKFKIRVFIAHFSLYSLSICVYIQV